MDCCQHVVNRVPLGKSLDVCSTLDRLLAEKMDDECMFADWVSHKVQTVTNGSAR